MIKKISISDGIPTIALSLVFIIALSMMKDLFEDIKWWNTDREDNERKTEIQFG